MQAVREALRDELTARGHAVGSDTRAVRGELYVMGDNDLAVALFEFKPSAREAFESMYQGAWVEGLPPRFAVMPSTAETDPEFELLEQVRIIPLLYSEADGQVRFHGLEALDEHLRG